MKYPLALCLFALTLSACQEPGACLANIEHAVEVEVRDGATAELLTTTPRGVVREGSFQDSLRVGSTTFENPRRRDPSLRSG